MKKNNNDIMNARIIANHKLYMTKIKRYRKLGYDVEKNREYIISNAKPLQGNILEVGTGKGHMAIVMGKEGFKFTSVDNSRENLDIARLNMKYFKLEDRVTFKKENAENMSFIDNVFDTIITVNTFHELKKPIKVIEELIRVLRPGGKIVISDFSAKGFNIVDKLHQAESSVHTKKNDKKFKDIEEYFVNKHFKVKYICNKYQQILIMSEEDK